MGYCIYCGLKDKVLGRRANSRVARGILLATAIVLSLLPDFDAGFGLLYHDFARYHNNLSHSLFVGAAFGLLGSGVIVLATGASFSWSFAFVFLCYGTHLVMDYFTIGRGVMLLWPFTAERYQPPATVFTGLHWSEGWLSVNHLVTLVNEAAFILVLYFVMQAVRSRRQAGRTTPPGTAG